MKATKISDSEISSMKVSALPTRPCAPVHFGGKGYTAAEVKEAFDKLPLYIIQKYNDLIDDLNGEAGESIADAIPTGIEEGHKLSDMLADIANGSFADYILINGKPLPEVILKIRQDIKNVASGFGIDM